MTDQTAYVNAYIDVLQEQLHGVINGDIQLRTQLRLAQGMIEALQEQIGSLNGVIAQLQYESDEGKGFSKELEKTKQELHAASAKASHIDTFARQIVDMKKIIKSQENKITELEDQLNKKKKTPPVVLEEVPAFKPEPEPAIKGENDF